MQSRILASAHLKVLVNGRLLGWTSGASFRIRTAQRTLYGVDSSEIAEFIPTTYSVGGTMEVYRGRLQGGAEGLGMVAFAENMLRQKYLTIELVDRATDTTTFKATGCVIVEQSWRISPKALVVGTFQFEGRTSSNEADL